eukprot:g841.t1
MIVLFAFLYLIWDVHWSCNIHLYRPGYAFQSFVYALYFSLETVLTIGYSTHDEFFNGCLGPLFLIFFQGMTSILIDVCLFGVVFAKFSRGQTRAASVLASKTCVMRKIRDSWYLFFQVCELRTEQLIEAHCRAYVLRDECDNEGTKYCFQVFPMRLQCPDDELGGVLLMNVPMFVVHRVDSWSPLVPPNRKARYDRSESYAFPDIPLRDGDVEGGTREGKTRKKYPTRKVLEAFLTDTKAKIVLVIEGTDPVTSCSVQKRVVYDLDDVEWNRKFRPCVSRDGSGGAVVDMRLFHRTMPAGRNARDDDSGAPSAAGGADDEDEGY